MIKEDLSLTTLDLNTAVETYCKRLNSVAASFSLRFLKSIFHFPQAEACAYRL
jgi:hypothetical protein